MDPEKQGQHLLRGPLMMPRRIFRNLGNGRGYMSGVYKDDPYKNGIYYAYWPTRELVLEHMSEGDEIIDEVVAGSSVVEQSLDKRLVAGSIPAPPTSNVP